MVRGNWQKRVERAETRRQNSKQQKQSRQNRSAYKQWVVNDLFPFLDNGDSKSMTLQIWTDTCPPKYQEEYFDICNRNDANQKRTTTSSNNNSNNSNNRKDYSKKQKKKKAHPRSNFKQSHPQEEDDVAMNAGDEDNAAESSFQVLCRQHFFTNKCNGYPSSCPYVHIHWNASNGKQPVKTLAQAFLIGKEDNKKKGSQSGSSNKVTDQRKQKSHEIQLQKSLDIFDNDCMDMVYAHDTIVVQLGPTNDDDKDENEDNNIKPSQVLSQALAQNSCPMATLVYVVQNDTLIFDRNRGGLVVDDSGDTSPSDHLQQTEGATYNSLMTNSITSMQRENEETFLHLPTSIWQQYILEYLPVQYTTMTVRRVCKAWNAEVSSCSNDLWKRYLERCHFPQSYPPKSTLEDEFKLHYNAMRDIAAIANASSEVNSIYSLLSTKKKKKHPNELSTIRAASSSHHNLEYLTTCYDYYPFMEEYREMITHVELSNVLPDCAISQASWLQIWDETSLLIAYPYDCSLQLWKKVTFGNKSVKMEMKSMFTSYVSPCPKKKKKQTTTSILLSMAIDETFVASCFYVENGRSKNSTFRDELEMESSGFSHENNDPSLVSSRPWLTVISREDLLEGVSDDASSTPAAQHRYFLDENILEIYDVKKVILDYLFEFPETNHLETEYTFGSGRLRQIYNQVKGIKIVFEERIGSEIAHILDNLELGSFLDETFLSPSILSPIMACDGKNGYFVCVVSLFSPSYHDNDDIIDDPCPIIILFSTEEGKIVWMYDLSTFPSFRSLTKASSSYENIMSVRRRKTSKTFTHFVLNFDQLVLPFHVENWTGVVHLHKRVDSVVNEGFLQIYRENGWSIDDSHNANCSMTLRNENSATTPFNIVAVRVINWKKQEPLNVRSASIIISDIPISDEIESVTITVVGSDLTFDEESNCRTIELDGTTVTSMETIRNDYVLLFCLAETVDDDSSHNFRETQNNNNNDDDSEISDTDDEEDAVQIEMNNLINVPNNGDVLINHSSSSMTNVAILIHIPSGMELCRYILMENDTNGKTLELFSAKCFGETLGLELGGKGIMLTGNNIRDDIVALISNQMEKVGLDMDDNLASPKNAKKKKKKRNANKNNKKDGFARGMSLRG